MTLDEAIKHAEEVAKEQDWLCKRYDDASGYTRSHNEDIRTTAAKKMCRMCRRTPTACGMVERAEGIPEKRAEGNQEQLSDGVGGKNDKRRSNSNH